MLSIAFLFHQTGRAMKNAASSFSLLCLVLHFLCTQDTSLPDGWKARQQGCTCLSCWLVVWGGLSPRLLHSTIPCIHYDILFQLNKPMVPHKNWNYFFFVMADALVALPHSDLLWMLWQMCLWLLVLSWWDMLHVCFSRDLDLLFSRGRYISFNQLSEEI